MTFRKRILTLTCCLAMGIVPSLAHAQDAEGRESPRPRRQGFTLELGIGAAFTYVAPERGDSQGRFGLAPLSLGIGGFLSPDVALLARMAGTSYFREDFRGNLHLFVNDFYGAHVQYWVNDDLVVSGGPGLTLFGANSWFNAGAKGTEAGFGGSVRLGVGVLSTKHHSLRFAIEAFPSKYKNTFVMGTALNFEWQYY